MPQAYLQFYIYIYTCTHGDSACHLCKRWNVRDSNWGSISLGHSQQWTHIIWWEVLQMYGRWWSATWHRNDSWNLGGWWLEDLLVAQLNKLINGRNQWLIAVIARQWSWALIIIEHWLATIVRWPHLWYDKHGNSAGCFTRQCCLSAIWVLYRPRQISHEGPITTDDSGWSIRLKDWNWCDWPWEICCNRYCRSQQAFTDHWPSLYINPSFCFTFIIGHYLILFNHYRD